MAKDKKPSVFSRLFGNRNKTVDVMVEEQIQSPGRMMLDNFLHNKLGMTGLIVFLLIFTLYTGPSFAINAIAAGKEAAISLHRYVHPGQTLTMGRDRRVYRALDKDHIQLEVGGFDKEHRQVHGYNAEKAKTFSDARVTFTEEQVRKECARCLGCGATKVDPYLCIGCGICTTRCKFDAIHLKKVRDWHAGTYETMPIKAAANLVKKTGGILKRAVTK